MNQPVFIRLENTYEAAMYYNNSPIMRSYSFNGVQLLPNAAYAYTQVALVELEDFIVELFSICDNKLADINPNLFEITTFQDPDTGENAIYWSYKPDDTDFGQQLVYLRFTQGANDYIYSSPFYLTNDGAEYTSRWDYWNKLNDTVLSTQINLHYIQPLTQITLNEYNEVYRGGYKSIVNRTKYERWRFGIVFIELFQMFADMMRNNYVYANLNRANLYKAYETPELVETENYAELNIDLYVNAADNYDPDYIPYVPPAPPEDMQIILDAVAGSGSNVIYTHHETGFAPIALVYQYSIDQVMWLSQLQTPASPQTVPVANWATNSYYYRIKDASSELYSNVLQLIARSVTLVAVTSGDSQFSTKGNRYALSYGVSGFEIPAGQGFTLECSFNDGVSFNAIADLVAPNPIAGVINFSITAPTEATKFRLRYSPFGLISNTATHEF